MMDFEAIDEARAREFGGRLAIAYGCHVKPLEPGPLRCAKCGVPIERKPRSRRIYCDTCGRERKTYQQREYREREA